MQAATVMAPRIPRIVAWSRMGDESLASRAAAGNQAAFSALCERYYGPLLGYCRSILLNADDAADATQSALENALRALPRREPGRPLRPWLYRIAHNEAINIVRRRQPVADAALDPAGMPTVPGPEVDADQRTRLAQLVDDLRMLPERQRGALVMRELSGLSYDDIALALGVSSEAARRAVFDARTALHDAVDGRETTCVSVRRTLSDGDRRRLRARGMRAHLRFCDDCATFERAIGARQVDLHALGPWIGGAGALSLIGIGAGGAGGGTLLAAGGGSGAVVGGGALGWAGLPTAIKGLAVAAVVATTGTAAVEIPKVSEQPRPAEKTARAAATAPAAISALHSARREQTLAPVGGSRRAGGTREAAAGVRTSGAGTSFALDRGESRATAVASAPVGNSPFTAPTAPAPGPSAAHPPAAGSRTQQRAGDLQRIREQILAALQSAQTIAAPGTPSALAGAESLVQSTLGAVRPLLSRILASVGLTLPTSSKTPAPPTTTQSVLDPVQSLLGDIDGVLQTLLGDR